MSEKSNLNTLEYFPLTLYKTKPKDFEDERFELRNHVGKVKHRNVLPHDDLELPMESILGQSKKSSPKLLYCITSMNEDYVKLVQSLAGVYRSYYELVNIDQTYLDQAHIVIISDGYDYLSEEFLL